MWLAPLSIQRATCEDIASGKTPEPSDLPPQARAMLLEMGYKFNVQPVTGPGNQEPA